MNTYLDLLTDDNMEIILNYITDGIDNKIKLLNKKINKLKRKLKPLSISYYEDEEIKMTCIDYEWCDFSMQDTYLFSNFDEDTEIILISTHDDFFGGENGRTYISKKLYKPTYLDILIEANKSIKITGDYHHRFLEGLNPISKHYLLDVGIRPKRNVKYFEFMLGS